jgi:hypothetical protein
VSFQNELGKEPIVQGRLQLVFWLVTLTQLFLLKKRESQDNAEYHGFSLYLRWKATIWQAVGVYLHWQTFAPGGCWVRQTESVLVVIQQCMVVRSIREALFLSMSNIYTFKAIRFWNHRWVIWSRKQAQHEIIYTQGKEGYSKFLLFMDEAKKQQLLHLDILDWRALSPWGSNPGGRQDS